jgi:hypothetical protein
MVCEKIADEKNRGLQIDLKQIFNFQKIWTLPHRKPGVERKGVRLI